MSAPEVASLIENGWVRDRNGVWRNPMGLRNEPNLYQLEQYRPEELSQRTLSPCGTPAAYRRHARWGEICDRCEQAKRDNLRALGKGSR